MSKYLQYFIFTLLLTLLTGCGLKPLETTEATEEANTQNLCEEQRVHLQQDKQALAAELGLAKKQIEQLKAERQQLKAKIDALTAIERSLHERKQRQSNE